MTTKPKAQKFRVRRPEDAAAQANMADAPHPRPTQAAEQTSAQDAQPLQRQAPAQSVARRPAQPQGAAQPRPAAPQGRSQQGQQPAQRGPQPAPGQQPTQPRPQQAQHTQTVRAAAPPQAQAQGQPRSAPPQGQPQPRTAAAQGQSGATAPQRPQHPAQMQAATARIPAAQAQGDAAMSGAADSPAQVSAETDIDAIRSEGLTGRQLRMARRVAQKHGLQPTSDFDAVRMLRARGIDPFQRANMLELVVPGGDKAKADDNEAKVQLPQTVDHPGSKLPTTETRPPESPADRRASEIMQIQRDLARRRRRKMVLLGARLAFFVLLPTLIAAHYFYNVATPMYSTKSEFLILTADGGSSGPGAGLLSGTQFATNQDAIAVQSYLTSKDAMLRLDGDRGFKEHFQQDWLDPIQRLDDDASNEDAYKTYKKMIQIGYDPTEGVIKMEVMAADPEIAAEFSRALIGYAEERVDNLSARKRANAVDDAEQGLSDAEAARREAQERLVRMQQEGAIIDPEGRIAALRQQINTFELQLQEKQLQLQALLDNRRPSSARVEGTQGDIRRLQALLAELNAQMTSATTGEDSLAETAVQIQMAQADLATRDMMLQTALERLETARRDAASQARYLTTSVVPVASEDPSYPRKFENTALAFLIFAGIYLMISLTASILREQVSS